MSGTRNILCLLAVREAEETLDFHQFSLQTYSFYLINRENLHMQEGIECGFYFFNSLTSRLQQTRHLEAC